MIWLLLIASFLVAVSNGQYEICPLSSSMDLNKTFSYFYPMDIYAPTEQFLRANASNEVYRCDGDELSEQRYPHYCSSKMERFCPVHHQNVKDATVHKYHRSSSLCHFKAKLVDKTQKINIFVLGGSVTAGHGADNCHQEYPKVLGHVPNHRCAWPYHFGRWLQQTSAANVSFYNLAMGGHDCYTRSMTFPFELKKLHDITQFTENDILFLDHSMNDQSLRMKLIEKGLEHLIRRIYSVSAPHSWPSIVVLDANPVDFFTPREWLYPAAYDKIVRHYNLSMWSYREAVHSNYSKIHQRNYSDYIRWNKNFEGDFHPTWHVHLFMADLFSAIFQSELNHCTEHLVQMAIKLHRSPVPLAHVPALTLADSGSECDANSSPYLSMSYFEHINKIPFVGKYSIKPAGGWVMREDRPGKGGFIAELEEGVFPPEDQGASIIFKLQETVETIRKTEEKRLQVHIVFLKTYENAGWANVFLCDQKIGALEALWEDSTGPRISVPEYFIESLDMQHCVNKTHPYISLKHGNNGPDDTRKRYKFKIIGIKVCKQGNFA